jgi:hypothetical protein
MLVDRRYRLELKWANEYLQTQISKDPNDAKHSPHLHDKYVVVPPDKAPNDIVFVRKSHYTDRLIKELGIGNSLGNPTYTPTTLTEVEILDKHMSVLCSFVVGLILLICLLALRGE